MEVNCISDGACGPFKHGCGLNANPADVRQREADSARLITKVIQTDCIAGLDSLEKGSIAAIITSPPYNIGKKYQGSDDNKDDYLIWMRSVFVACKRALADDGHFFLQVGGIPKRPLIPWEVLNEALAAGFPLQNQIVWVKSIAIEKKTYGHFKPINSKRFLNHLYEFIFHLTDNGAAPIDRLAVGVPFVDGSNIQRFRHKENLRCQGNVWFIPYDTIQSNKERYNHPTVFPVALPEMCIKLAGIPQGSLVVDPFVGTGTTLVACKRLQMNGIGFDISPEYCKMAEDRLMASNPITEQETPVAAPNRNVARMATAAS
jgi:site-specific DNA-methyltransferase (adenine-specific)